jgi:uncharacterized delta-60 repeat protein
MNTSIISFTRFLVVGLAFGVSVLATEPTNVVVTKAIGASPESKRILIKPDGKILVFGSFGKEVKDFDQFLVQFNQTGTLDKGFGRQGVVQENLGGTDIAVDALLQTDGKIVTLTSSGLKNPNASRDVLMRYNRDGKPDPKFGVKGRTILKLGQSDSPVGLALQNNGDFLVGGYASLNTPEGDFHWAFTLHRFKADGVLDTSFGAKGQVIYKPRLPRVFVRAMHMQPDGKVVMAGFNSPDDPFDLAAKMMVVVRFLPDGRLDTTFGNGGVIERNLLEAAVIPLEIRSLKSGHILIAGGFQMKKGEQSSVIRLIPNGEIDTSFGSQGLAMVPSGSAVLPEPVRPKAFTLQADGKLILAGETVKKVSNVVLVRFSSSGQLDSSFATDGIKIIEFDGRDLGVKAVATQADGKLTLAGDVYLKDGSWFVLSRILPNGETDKDLK